MGLFDKFKKKHETRESTGKVRHVVEDEKKPKKEKEKKEKKAKKPEVHKALTKEEIKAAQQFEGVKPEKVPEKGAPEKEKEGKKEAPKRVPHDTKAAYRILIKPMVTEKSSYGASMGMYAFQVASRSTKPEIAKAVAALYQVNPVAVRIVNTKGKKIRFGKTTGRMKDVKKAYVTLKKGQTIDVSQ